jgi:hypothetical protein
MIQRILNDFFLSSSVSSGTDTVDLVEAPYALLAITGIAEQSLCLALCSDSVFRVWDTKQTPAACALRLPIPAPAGMWHGVFCCFQCRCYCQLIIICNWDCILTDSPQNREREQCSIHKVSFVQRRDTMDVILVFAQQV